MAARSQRTLAAAVLCALLAGPAESAGGGETAACRRVASGDSLPDAVEQARPGQTLCLDSGLHRGPVVVRKALTLRGPSDAVIRSGGTGTTVSLEAAGAALLGVTVDGSGGRFDRLDAAVHITHDDVRVEDITVRGALFGILAERARRVVIRGNEVEGQPEKALGLRGDGIRIWEVRDSTIAENHLTDSRDIVVWYSPGNRIVGNVVERGRYGTHFMYSHDSVVEDNRYVENVVGIFVMYSRGITIRRNLVARSAGAAGVALGAKESGNLRVEDNWFVANQVGIYLDTSPLTLSEANRFARNAFHLGDTAIVFHGGAARNHFLANSFRDNAVTVRVEGRGDAYDAEWRGNSFDDYAGYDLDGDGTGDIPYELRSLSGALTARQPSLRFFRGSLALALVELVGRAVPIFQPRSLLVDSEPRISLPAPQAARAG